MKIYVGRRLRILVRCYRCLAEARLGSEHVGDIGLGVPNTDFVVPSGATNFGTTDDIEERPSE
jgi:hypothetical protein